MVIIAPGVLLLFQVKFFKRISQEVKCKKASSLKKVQSFSPGDVLESWLWFRGTRRMLSREGGHWLFFGPIPLP